MKVVCFSDIHGRLDDLKLPQGDILIFAGDIGNPTKSLEEVERFARFMLHQKFEHKIVVAGNHDFPLEDERKDQAEKILDSVGILYLNDSHCSVESIHIWGSPVCPYFHNWAFNKKEDKEIQKHWDQIPPQIDILITHTPPHGILDQTNRGQHIGSKDLRDVVDAINPKYHIFGHAHESYGALEYLGTRYINASSLSPSGDINPPITFQL